MQKSNILTFNPLYKRSGPERTALERLSRILKCMIRDACASGNWDRSRLSPEHVIDHLERITDGRARSIGEISSVLQDSSILCMDALTCETQKGSKFFDIFFAMQSAAIRGSRIPA